MMLDEGRVAIVTGGDSGIGHAICVALAEEGAGGGTLAHRLAPSGKRILLLDRGDFLPRELPISRRSRR